MPFTLVTFHAHPDDEALLTAGTMARAAAEGHRVVLVVATAGEVGDAADRFRDSDGPGDLGGARRAELARSAEILGVARIVELGYRDSGLDGRTPAPPGGATPFATVPVDEAAARLATVLEEEGADVLTTYDRFGGYGHADHVAVHHVGHRAAELAGTPVVLESTIDRQLMRTGVELATSLGYEVPDEFATTAVDTWFTPTEELTHAVDVAAHLPAKRAAMEAHASQATSAAGGERSLSRFLALPEEYFALAFGTEWFVERGREPGAVDDVFASLRERTGAGE